MTRGGARKGSGRKAKTQKEKRHPLNCLASYQTVVWINSERERTNKSIGELVDLAVEVLQEHPEKLPPDAMTEEEETETED